MIFKLIMSDQLNNNPRFVGIVLQDDKCKCEAIKNISVRSVKYCSFKPAVLLF